MAGVDAKARENRLAKKIQAALAGKASSQVTVKATLTGPAAEVWAAIREDRSGIFVPLTDDIQMATIEILKDFPRLVDTKRQRQQADPFVIALARGNGAAVLTAETHRANGSKAPKVPDVCDHYGVECHSFLDLIQIEGWVF